MLRLALKGQAMKKYLMAAAAVLALSASAANARCNAEEGKANYRRAYYSFQSTGSFSAGVGDDQSTKNVRTSVGGRSGKRLTVPKFVAGLH
jgi:opacity protein-like surface antigen